MSESAAIRPADIVYIAIGRNEGERFRRCLASLKAVGDRIVYVDSGSTDGSADHARAEGAEVVDLDLSRPFTAARARNEGMERALSVWPEAPFIQFVDGDCALDPGWPATALAAMADDPALVAVAGRRREVDPDFSWYNELCDIEWNTPVGEARAVGGDALYRTAPLRAVGGFDPRVIAGEEPELCQRLRRNGGTIARLDAEMTLHDAAMDRFGQFWKRQVRAGYAYALGALMHGRGPDRHFVKETLRAVLWGGVLPVLFLLFVLGEFGLGVLAILALYGFKLFRVSRYYRGKVDKPVKYAGFLMIANVAEAVGVARLALDRLTGKASGIIEYK